MECQVKRIRDYHDLPEEQENVYPDQYRCAEFLLKGNGINWPLSNTRKCGFTSGEVPSPGKVKMPKNSQSQLLSSVNRELLTDFIKEQNQPAFRINQILDWIYRKRQINPDNMKNLPQRFA